MTSDIVASAHGTCGRLSIRRTSSHHMLRGKSSCFCRPPGRKGEHRTYAQTVKTADVEKLHGSHASHPSPPQTQTINGATGFLDDLATGTGPRIVVATRPNPTARGGEPATPPRVAGERARRMGSIAPATHHSRRWSESRRPHSVASPRKTTADCSCARIHGETARVDAGTPPFCHWASR